jgi:hypothetical protein
MTGGRRCQTGRLLEGETEREHEGEEANQKIAGRRRCHTERGQEGEEAKPEDHMRERMPDRKMTRGRRC